MNRPITATETAMAEEEMRQILREFELYKQQAEINKLNDDLWFLRQYPLQIPKSKKRGGDSMDVGMPEQCGTINKYDVPVIRQIVNVERVENGFVVHVGCKTFVFATWKEVSDGLEFYFIDPKAAEKKYCNRGVKRK